MRYVVEKKGNSWFVYDNVKKNHITKAVPTKAIADEIAEDFNLMDGGDYSPITFNPSHN